jgi:DNA-binding transcriptional MerR regulator
MAAYTMTDAENLLGVKAHVIRYWEQEIPLIQSKKDINGRRFYSNREMQILFRLKHLLYVRRFTIEGARQELYQELTGNDQDIRSHLSILHSELLDLYLSLKKGRK